MKEQSRIRQRHKSIALVLSLILTAGCNPSSDNSAQHSTGSPSSQTGGSQTASSPKDSPQFTGSQPSAREHQPLAEPLNSPNARPTLGASMAPPPPPPPRFLARPSTTNSEPMGLMASMAPMTSTASMSPRNNMVMPLAAPTANVAPTLIAHAALPNVSPNPIVDPTSSSSVRLTPSLDPAASPAPRSSAPTTSAPTTSAPLDVAVAPRDVDSGSPDGSLAERSPSENQQTVTSSDSAASDAGSEKFDTVRLFYATDRATVGVESQRPNPTWPLCIAGLAFGAYMMAWMMGTGTRSWFTYLGHVGVVALIATTSYVAIQWQRSEELKINDRVLYSNDRAPQGVLDLGVCSVTIPKTHEIGVMESPSLLRLEVRHDKERHIFLDRVDRLESPEFYTQLNAAINAAEVPEVFVFIHGYNVEFDDAARRTAQLAFDLKYKGTPICYSWPSQGGLLKYTIDETNVVWTVPHLKAFLMDVVSHSGAKAVNLVAHSMGNRALTATLRELALELGDQSRLFRNVVLAAPDVDAEVFRQMAPDICRTANYVTLYASSNDNALIASKKVHGYPRAGESGRNLVIVPGIETIDVSTIDTSLLGHSYYGSSDSVLSDLYHLVMQSLPARERRWLEPRSLDGLTYWVFHKRNEAFTTGVPALARQPTPVLDVQSR